ncbi:Zona pellucida sperm-binding protein 3 [Anabarilius grahami]|uniref:Zona pellucida sperm-binding protein 3 n=1 Tax=Anabarilius grahami TaxID=495550 RepID=A0A3N0XNH3_ANAGA|nr:Zona pellucida sperm-binding protein 3 [Anabarilius grahami]
MAFLQGVLVMVVLVVFDLPDAWGSLRYSRSPRSMRPKSDPASRSPALSPLGLWNTLQVDSQFQSSVSRDLAQDPFGLQEKQLLQGPVKPFDWRYPVVPEVQRELAVDFQLRQPMTPSSVAVQCSENRVLVEDTEARVLIFEYELQDCNSVLMMNEDELVYTFSITYTPEALAGTPITRADAVVGVQCHYQRLQNVSSNALRPTWVPYASMEVGEEVLLFSLKLMMDDWSHQRPSNSYFLGGVINIEASVKVYNHVPLRVFVDSCVATQGPDVNSLPRYSFIENHGCFVDAKATASSSRFMPWAQEGKIQFQLEAFMFQESSSPYVYITCILKATIASVPSDAQRKSCSFANGWFAADGNNQVCGCCDSTCGPDGGFASPYGDAGRPDCSELAAAATHDDGADAFTVHLHLQSPHSVPEKLQTDLRPALARRRCPPSPMSPSQSLSPPEPRTHRTGGGAASLSERFLAVLVTGRDMSRGKSLFGVLVFVPLFLVLYVPGLVFSSLFLVSVCYIGFSFWITFTDHHTDTRTHLTDHHSLRTFTAHRSPCVTTLLLSVLLLCVYIVSYNLA